MFSDKKANSILIKIVGILILGRGLFHIIFMGNYIEYVSSKFFNNLPFESLLIICASFFPFIEFFIGLLLIFKVKLKKTLITSILVYVTLIVFTIIEAYYEQTAYLLIVLLSLIYIYKNSEKEIVNRII